MYDQPRSRGWTSAIKRNACTLTLRASAVAALFLSMAPQAVATEHDLCVSEVLPELENVTFLRSYRPDVHGPSRLAIDLQGDVLITDPARNQVVVREPNGRVVDRRSFPTAPHAIAVSRGASGGRVTYLGLDAGSRVAAFSAEWETLFELGVGAGEFLAANDIAVDPVTGAVYVVDSEAHMVKAYSPDGGALGGFGGFGEEPGLFHFPTAVAIDPVRREVLVADQMNFRVQIFNLAGDFLCRLGDANGADPGAAIFGTRTRLFTVPQGLAVDDLGRIYIADAAEGRVRVTDRDGVVLAEIGGFGAGADQLRVPLDLVTDANGRLFVSDSNNSRIAMYGLGSYSDPELFAPAHAVVSPDPFDRLGVPVNFEATIEIPGYRLNEAAAGSITANGVPAIGGSVVVGDRDSDGEQDLLAQFDREALAATLPSRGPSPISIRGAVAGLTFDATALITVIGAAADADEDGVTDDVDACLGTAADTVVDEDGCALAQLCPCAARLDGQPWPTHGDYVECAAAQSRRFVDARLIGRAEMGGIVGAAARAACPGGG